MKKIILSSLVLYSVSLSAQFSVSISANNEFTPKEAYVYTTSGSKDVLVTKVIKKNNEWKLKYSNPYSGMMKVYFPEINYTLNFVSENRDVSLRILGQGKEVESIAFLDEANKAMDAYQAEQRRKENILPVLYQMVDFYKPETEFYKAMEKEIMRLSSTGLEENPYPFSNFYIEAYQRFVSKNVNRRPTQAEIMQFITNAGEYLETSSLLRPILVAYLSKAQAGQESAIDELLAAIDVESPRGQTVLSELIDLFDAYSMTALKEKYLTQAKNLKCEINDRLSYTIKINEKTAVGSIFEDYQFKQATNTKAKSFYDIKADRKVIVFWSSTCSHCETELPKFIPYYSQLKANNVEIIGFSLDSAQRLFDEKARVYPWINDTELRGWYSNFVEKYNVKATPSYFILDKNNKIISKPDRLNDVLNELGVK